MTRKRRLMYTCYALLPLFSVFLILALSWLLVAIIEIYTNNLTMLNTLNRFTMHADGGKKLTSNPPFPGKDLDNTFWFVQVSDIHISKYRSYGQVKDLEMFCLNWLPIIKPSLVLLTGDLTDAKDETKIGSSQYEEEWVVYSSLVNKCMNGATRWLDIRGNHDSFAVASLSHSENMFEKYGISRKKYVKNGVYQYIHNTSYGKYAFNGIDVAPNPGPGRPFNFFGVPHQKTLSMIEKISSASNFNATVWFGHYPLSTTTNPHLLRKLLSLSGVVYLCGHLHTLLGAFPQMHAAHSEGLLELEIGDWKLSRRFRIGVFDHDVFSFTDVTYSADPIVVFTNPIDASYIIPDKIPFMKSWNSTHIRILVFHTLPIHNAEVSVDGVVICINTEVVQNILHVCKWNPFLYMYGVHQLTLTLQDNHGALTKSGIEFSLDGTRPPLALLSVILLLTDFCTMLRMIFLTTIVLTIILPVVVKKYSHTHYIGLIRHVLHTVLPQILYFIDCDRVFWPLIYYSCYLCIGPFSMGYFVPEQLGFAFPYGIYTGGHFIEGSVTFLYVAGQLLLFNSIMMLYVGEILISSTSNRIDPYRVTWFRRVFFKLIFMFLLCCETYSMYMYWVAYGILSSFSNALSTWTIPLAFYLTRQASKKNT